MGRQERGVAKRKQKRLKAIQRELENKTDNMVKRSVKKHYVAVVLVFLLFGSLTAFFLAQARVKFFQDSQNKFHDLEIELGTPSVSLADFLNENAELERSTLVTDLKEIDFHNVGTYPIYLKYNGVEQNVNLKIVDTVPPVLEVKNVVISDQEKITSVFDFVTKKEDLSGDVNVNMSAIDYTKEVQDIIIVATDKNGNLTEKTATLTINFDKKAPVFTGLTTVSIKKGGPIDYKKNVVAKDERDGVVEYTIDTTKVNINASGTYYAVYTASDKSGNTATAKRKIIIEQDLSDRDALVKKIAAKLSNNPEELRDYCRNNIKYNSNAGGSDPLYYGLTKWKGNCLVHAYCFKALLDEKGIENQFIWVTDKSHYWNLVKINGVWRHMDATPSTKHGKYSIMTDSMRLETLSGRDWDHTAWPAST